MSRYPLTTLEEDLKGLGLLAEDAELKPAPSGEPVKAKGSNSRNVGAMTDDPEGGEDKEHEPSGPAPHAGDTGPMGPSGYQKPVPMRAKASESKNAPKGASAVSEALGRIRGARTQEEAVGAVARAESLIENVRTIMGEIAESQRAESVKAFANVSVIAEMLSTGFAGFAEKYEDAELAEAAEALSVLSGEAAEIAEILNTEDEVDDVAVEEEFRNEMNALVSSLDLYSDIVEADEHLETETVSEESEDDEDDKEDEKKSKKDDDKDDEDEKDDEEDGKKEEAVVDPRKLAGAHVLDKLAAKRGAEDYKSPAKKAASSVLDKLGKKYGESVGEAYMPYGDGSMGKGKKGSKK